MRTQNKLLYRRGDYELNQVDTAQGVAPYGVTKKGALWGRAWTPNEGTKLVDLLAKGDDFCGINEESPV